MIAWPISLFQDPRLFQTNTSYGYMQTEMEYICAHELVQQQQQQTSIGSATCI